MAKNASQPGDADKAFEAVSGAFATDRSVTRGKMFGSAGMKVKNKVFAMLVKGELVVKLPRERVEAIVASKRGKDFDPGHGRLMKEWVAVGSPSEKEWIHIAREARDFVASLR